MYKTVACRVFWNWNNNSILLIYKLNSFKNFFSFHAMKSYFGTAHWTFLFSLLLIINWMSELAVVNLLAINLINLFFFFYFNILPYLTGNTITFFIDCILDINSSCYRYYRSPTSGEHVQCLEPLVDSPENVSFLEKNLLTNFINMDFPCWSYS